MEKSESIKNIAKALILFHEKCGTIAKESENPFFKSSYASLANIQESIREPLQYAGLAYSQLPEMDNVLTTILMHSESGEYILSSYAMKPVKDDPQGRGSCITYQKRYALAAVLGLCIDDDDDGNAASQPAQQKKPQQQQQPVRNATPQAQPAKADLLTAEQSAKLTSLLSHQVFTDNYKNKVIAAMDAYTVAKANEMIKALDDKITQWKIDNNQQ